MHCLPQDQLLIILNVLIVNASMVEASFYCVDCKHTLFIFNVESQAVSAFSKLSGLFFEQPSLKLYKALEQKSLTELSFIISSQTQFRLYRSPLKVTQFCFALFCCSLGRGAHNTACHRVTDKILPHSTDKGGPLCTSLDSISVVKEKLNWTRKK